ncbi:antigen 5 like allergen Cul n 1-like [Calliphora vicina]|uniref:antigen 5 like allergen Cul n 1-like n=1 Tax=Calliphora vicina TaxID=7373 RepID=UPI00325B4231
MCNFFVLLIIVAAIVTTVLATDYCSPKICGDGVKHIACGHSGNFAASCPKDAALVHFDDKLKDVAVKAHNVKRNFIAGGGDGKHSPACRMATMEWDDELAAIAELNVKQCTMAHDKCRNTDAFSYAGQNLAWLGYMGQESDASMLQQAVDMWYSEIDDCKLEYIKAYPPNYKGPAIGHFTVMVTDRNIRVGCAAATYSEVVDDFIAFSVACNYATTNLIYYPVYASCIKAATSCTTGVNPIYPNLCSTAEVYDLK